MNMIEIRKNKEFGEYLEELLAKSECDELEYKSAAGGFPESFWETYSAFANTDGGIIVFGVAEKKGQFYLDKLSEDPDERWTNRICPDGTWECNLFQFYRLVLPRLQTALPKPFKLENNIRKDETPAHVAVREALINFIIHPDYSENASNLTK